MSGITVTQLSWIGLTKPINRFAPYQQNMKNDQNNTGWLFTLCPSGLFPISIYNIEPPSNDLVEEDHVCFPVVNDTLELGIKQKMCKLFRG